MNYYFINSDAGIRNDIKTCDLLIEHGIATSGGDYKKYATPLKKFSENDICLLYHDNQGIVAIGQVLEKWDGHSHTQNKIIYPDNYPEYRLKVNWFLDLRKNPIDPLNEFGYTPRGVVQRVVKKLDDVSNFIEEYCPLSSAIVPDEIQQNEVLAEGEQSDITVTVKKRNQIARAKCLEYWGEKCVVCHFNFEEKYGALGATGIHVHHLHPISSITEVRTVDPIKDLRPVCANCHAMIHKKNPPYTPEELAEFINKAESK